MYGLQFLRIGRFPRSLSELYLSNKNRKVKKILDSSFRWKDRKGKKVMRLTPRSLSHNSNFVIKVKQKP